MPDTHDRIIDELMEQLVAQGPGGMAAVFTRLFNLAMRFERENYLNARHYERTDERRGYANGIKPKRIDTAAGTLVVDVPKTAGTDEPFYPRSLERGTRSSRALMLAVAEMYVKGVSTRDVADILDKFGIDGLSSSQVSRASKLLDHDLEQWRERPLGEVRYLILDARYEKVRIDGIVRDATILSAIGIGPDSRRSLLGVSVALSEAEVHWRAFLDSLGATKTLVVANGAYGDRAAAILARLGRPVTKIDKGDSAAPSLEDVTTMLDADGTISHVWMIHCETTSGVVNPIHEVAEAVKERNRSFMVDAMSSFGALPVNMGGAGMDVMVSSSNKCIEGVPGFSYVLVKRKLLEASRGKCHSVVLDLYEQWKGLEQNGQFRFTPPTHALVAFRQALREHQEQGGVAARGVGPQLDNQSVLADRALRAFA